MIDDKPDKAHPLPRVPLPCWLLYENAILGVIASFIPGATLTGTVYVFAPVRVLPDVTSIIPIGSCLSTVAFILSGEKLIWVLGGVLFCAEGIKLVDMEIITGSGYNISAMESTIMLSLFVRLRWRMSKHN